MKKNLMQLLLVLLALSGCRKNEPVRTLLVNHTGYATADIKKVVLQTSSGEAPESFRVLNELGEVVFEGTFEEGGIVDHWHTGLAYAGDFTEFNKEGTFTIVAEASGSPVKSRSFPIDRRSYADKTLELLIEGFESQHITGAFDTKDREMTFFGERKDTVDVHGGWYDASGDRAKYLSHLSYANYLNPQQTPLWVWTLIESARRYNRRKSPEDQQLKQRMLDEAAYGADFLMRMLDPEGYFYMTVFAQWSGKPERRLICAYKGQDGELLESYQAGFREGGGMAIAALARASQELDMGEYSPEAYLESARKGFAHLKEHNLEYLDDGRENIIDDYCALMAATELFAATNELEYLEYARLRMHQLSTRLSQNEDYAGWWRADEQGQRPFFHASDAGLPLVALNRFLQFDKEQTAREVAITTIQKSIAFELGVTREVHNPFGYPRQYVKGINDDHPRTAFFIPHQNESGYWWQGENARLSSLVAAVNLNSRYMNPLLQSELHAYRGNIMNWLLGLNPFDICMVDGLGYNNPEYLEPTDLNFRGGVCNGITAGFSDESDIAFMPAPYDQDPAQRWRWAEQWMPHAAWLMLAVSSADSEEIVIQEEKPGQ